MADEPENIVLVYLRRIDEKVDRLAADVREVRDRLSSVEQGVITLRREVVGVEEAVAHTNARVDRVTDRLERIERRLDLNDTLAPT